VSKHKPDMSEFPKEYPKLFENVYCGYSCGAGWYPLLHTLCKLLQSYAENKSLNIRIAQIKEKFGGLRFYYDGADDYAEGLVRMAEAMSWHICEDCGTTESVETKGGWIKTLCESCRRLRNERI